MHMMQMHFTRLGREARERDALPEGASVTDLAIAQLLGLREQRRLPVRRD